ncbi:hypothetical protein [Chryseosolibacter indicus]|uniref:Uncharacterized protein n=1 Tax=Chryseosolibacter indicus TaxID=2782351 RepID=A0ABS5VW22_9BACT|nr:hypothetical protein [Chryseosolibacter indicus]MBT1705531.1 hypothetical protein [Chryseosolibacter indicus]
MRTSLNEIRTIERYLQEKMTDEEKLSFEIELSENKVLQLHLGLQKKVYRLIDLYHRRFLKREVAHIHHIIFSDPAKVKFQESVRKIFKP